MNDFKQNTNTVAPKVSTFNEGDMHNIPFDDFYLFLNNNKDFTAGKNVSKKLQLKFIALFDGDGPDLLNNMKDISNKADRQSLKMKTEHANKGINLGNALYDYERAVSEKFGDKVDRQESLEVINEILTPFYTASLKVEVAPKKKKRFGFF